MRLEERVLLAAIDRSATPGDAAEADWASVRIAVGAAAGGEASSEAPLPPEGRRLVVYRGEAPVARVAYGARRGFAGAPGITGYIGWYEAVDEKAGAHALRSAAEKLLSEGAARVVGPLDGSTWYRYRVTLPGAVAPEQAAPFLSEPRNPPDWPLHFAAAGFVPVRDYETRLVRNPEPDAALPSRRAKLEKAGVLVRPLDLAEYPRELRTLYDLSIEAFAVNPFYTPISFNEFEALYAGLRPYLDPALVRIAENREGRVLGYVFAFPDLLASPGHPRIVLKTLAAAPRARGSGLGRILTDDIHGIAGQRGATVLHALMEASNVSRNISGRSESELFRRYVLYEYGQA